MFASPSYLFVHLYAKHNSTFPALVLTADVALRHAGGSGGSTVSNKALEEAFNNSKNEPMSKSGDKVQITEGLLPGQSQPTWQGEDRRLVFRCWQQHESSSQRPPWRTCERPAPALRTLGAREINKDSWLSIDGRKEGNDA